MYQIVSSKSKIMLGFIVLLLPFLVSYINNMHLDGKLQLPTTIWHKHILPTESQVVNSSATTPQDGFKQAIPFVLRHEGGLVNNRSDSGGITKYGISLRYLRSLLAKKPSLLHQFSLTRVSQVGPAVIKRMKLSQAIDIYRQQWWVKYNFISLTQQNIATKAFDLAINMGPKKAIALLQKACRLMAGNSSIRVSGKLDPTTIAFINQLDSNQAKQLLLDYNNVAANHYRSIANHHPKNRKFLVGWLRRAHDNQSLA